MVYSQYFPQNATKIDEPLVMSTSPIDDMIDTMMGGKEEYGKLFVREHRADILDGWMAPEPVIGYVESPKSDSYTIPTMGREHQGNIAGVKLPYASGYMNMRDIGKFASVGHDAERHLRDFMLSDVGAKVASKYSKLMEKAGEIDYIIVFDDPEGSLYAVSDLEDGNAAFWINRAAYKKMEAWAEMENIDVEDLMQRAMGEEVLHIIRKGKATIKEEEEVRESLIEVYSELVEGTSNPKLREKYGKMVEHLREDLSSVRERYSKHYSKGYVELYTQDIGKLEAILEAEAIASEGLEGEEVSEYVTAMLGEIAEAAEKGCDAEYAEAGEDAEGGESGEGAEGGDGGEGE